MVKLKIIPSLDEDLLCSTMGSKENGHQIRAHYTANLPKFFFFFANNSSSRPWKGAAQFSYSIGRKKGKKVTYSKLSGYF